MESSRGGASEGGSLGEGGSQVESRAGTYFLGRYRVVDEIGIGGMATVHLARVDGPGGFQKWVAIKRIHAHLVEDEAFVHMFLDEARIAARISHPNVATVFELGKHEDTYWIAMEYLHGEPLREVMRRTEELGAPMPPEIACRVIADAAEGLHAAHELLGKNGETLQLVHRDVTPHNLFVTYDGNTKVVDFGIAKFASRMANTRAGTLKGKLAYMSPEQVHGEPIDRRTDIFALGVVLWELTTGQRLFRMESDLDTLAKVQECNVPLPSSIIQGYPIDLEKIVMKALAKNKSDRFRTAREFSRALQSLLMRRGLFIASDEVANYVQAIFEDRIAKREAHLRWAADVTQTINLEGGAEGVGDDTGPNPVGIHDSIGSLSTHAQPVTAQKGMARAAPRPAAGVPPPNAPPPRAEPLKTTPSPKAVEERASTPLLDRDEPDAFAPTLQAFARDEERSRPMASFQDDDDDDDGDETVMNTRIDMRAPVHEGGPAPAAGRPSFPQSGGTSRLPDVAGPSGMHHPRASYPSAIPQAAPSDPQASPRPNQALQIALKEKAASAIASQHLGFGTRPGLSDGRQDPTASLHPENSRELRTVLAQRPFRRPVPVWVVFAASCGTALVFAAAIIAFVLHARPSGEASVTARADSSANRGPFGEARADFAARIAPTSMTAPSTKLAPLTSAMAPSDHPLQERAVAPSTEAPSAKATDTLEPHPGRAERTPPHHAPSAPAPTGLLSVICVPACDEVIDNGRPLGPSPIFKRAVSVGEHRLKLTSTTPPVTKTVSVIVIADQLNTQRVTMSP